MTTMHDDNGDPIDAEREALLRRLLGHTPAALFADVEEHADDLAILLGHEDGAELTAFLATMTDLELQAQVRTALAGAGYWLAMTAILDEAKQASTVDAIDVNDDAATTILDALTTARDRARMARDSGSPIKMDAIESFGMNAAEECARLIAVARYSDERKRAAFVRRVRRAVGFTTP